MPQNDKTTLLNTLNFLTIVSMALMGKNGKVQI